VLKKAQKKSEFSDEFDWAYWYDIANELGFSKEQFLSSTVRQLCAILESRIRRREEAEKE
jgi:hypothetical protein